MVHPCRTGNPGTTMHACDTEFSDKTLCGLDVDVPTINKVWGFKALCPGCYPVENPVKGPGAAIGIPGREKLPDNEPEELLDEA